MTVYDTRDYDAEIAKALAARNQLQARYDSVKYSYDTSAIVDAKVALGEAERKLRELRRGQEAAQRVEPLRNSSVFVGSNG